MDMYYGTDECSHVHSIHKNEEKFSKESGNLYLSGLSALDDKKIK